MNKTVAHVYQVPIEVTVKDIALVEVHAWGDEWHIHNIDLLGLSNLDEKIAVLDKCVDLREEINEYIRQESK